MNTRLILDFIQQLQLNNHKAWMDSHQALYHAARKELIAIADFLIKNTATFDLTIANLQPKDIIFRINRDIRFSKDKQPYKSYMGLFLAQGGKKSDYAGYYLHLSPGNQSFIAGGLFEPTSATLHKVRQEIDYHGKELAQILTSPQLQQLFGNLQGEKLQRPPKGYTADNPHIEWLKYKSLIVMHPLQDHQITQPNFLNKVVLAFQTIQPLNQFFNRALDD
jgi:uncharacterized protein (TIGR02453 family)